MAKLVPLLSVVSSCFKANTKEENFSLILGGAVYVNNSVNRNPKALVASDATIEIRKKKYVSRGGYKLEAALNAFNIDLTNKVVLDAGASTGGFSDCLVQHGARLVYSVDVGYNQLDYKLRVNPKIISMEKTNIKDVESLNPPCDFVVADLSFRSIVPVLSKLFSFSKDGHILVLLKPQFELDPKTVSDFDGVIRDASMIKNILISFYEQATTLGYFVKAIIASPIKGSRGNQEFLVDLYNEKKTCCSFYDKDSFLEVVEKLCNEL